MSVVTDPLHKVPITFRFVLFHSGVPFMGCHLRSPLFAYLFNDSSNWKPEVNRSDAELALEEHDKVDVVLSCQNGRSTWTIARTTP